MTLKRCSWVKLNNPLYVKYHDEEWGKLVKDEQKLFDVLLEAKSNQSIQEFSAYYLKLER